MLHFRKRNNVTEIVQKILLARLHSQQMYAIIHLKFRGTEGIYEFYRKPSERMKQYSLISLGSSETGTGRNTQSNRYRASVFGCAIFNFGHPEAQPQHADDKPTRWVRR